MLCTEYSDKSIIKDKKTIDHNIPKESLFTKDFGTIESVDTERNSSNTSNKRENKKRRDRRIISV
jgi:hypothetical protein